MTTIANISFAPLIPWELLAIIAAFALLFVGYAIVRRLPGAWWRSLALAVGLLALANPALVEEQREPLTDVAVILVDESPSQDVGERRNRAERAVAQLERRFAGYGDLETRVVYAGGREAGDAAMPDGTHLIGALRRALSDVPRQRVAGAVLVTDGQVHDLGAEVDRDDPGGPVHVLLTGERGERDRRLVIEQAPRYGIVGEGLGLTLNIEDQGVGGDGAAEVTVKQDDGPPQSYIVPIGSPYTVPFTLRHGGLTVLEVEVEAGTDELTTINNRAVVVVNGVRDRLRVLLVSGEPHAGERTWRNLLKADPSVDLVHFTILRPPEKQDGTPIRELSLISFPTRELFQTKLDEFDLVIFDRYRRRGVLPDLYLRNVVEYVRQGGAVLTAAGPAFATPLSLHRTPLAQVLPTSPTGDVITGGFRPELTEAGRRHPVTAELPGAQADEPDWGRWFRLIDVDLMRGTTLMQGSSDRPVLILDRIGEGRVAQLLSDHAWLWTRGFEGGGPQAELLRRVAHWLMKEPDLEEEDLRAAADGNRLEIWRRSLAPGGGDVTVTAPSGREFTVTLSEDETGGLARGSLQVNEPGLYRLSDGTRTTVAAVGVLNPLEYADLRSSPQPLAPLVERTGGGGFWLSDGIPDIRRVKPERDAAGRSWLGLRANGDYLVTGVEQIPMLPALVVLALVLGVTMLAWHREGR